RAGSVRLEAQLRTGDHSPVEEDGVGGRSGPDLERAILLGEEGGSEPLGNGCRTRYRVHGPPSTARCARAPRSAARLAGARHGRATNIGVTSENGKRRFPALSAPPRVL